jgi:hypothetical protein
MYIAQKRLGQFRDPPARRDVSRRNPRGHRAKEARLMAALARLGKMAPVG